jgi:hypothetical protein
LRHDGAILIATWVTEPKKAWEGVAANLGDRELVIDIEHLTCINRAGENALFGGSFD